MNDDEEDDAPGSQNDDPPASSSCSVHPGTSLAPGHRGEDPRDPTPLSIGEYPPAMVDQMRFMATFRPCLNH